MAPVTGSNGSDSQAPEQLPIRIITYMCPSLPAELFELIASYLEYQLHRETMLIQETRFSGPISERVDPFRSNLAELGEQGTENEATPSIADMAFLSTSGYQKLKEAANTYWELLPIGAVHPHPKGERAGYYADVIIHTDSKERIKEFLDLRGGKLACNDPTSISGHLMMLKKLRDSGENSSFFGNVLNSKTHLGSVQMVAVKQADVASVDSNALAFELQRQPDLCTDVFIFDSLGPLPPYPIMVRSSMPENEKKAIQDALLNMHKQPEWAPRFAAFRVLRYEDVDPLVYEMDKEVRELVKDMVGGVPYY